MDRFLSSSINDITGATSFEVDDIIQELWSGYGKIIKVRLQDTEVERVVVKQVQLPKVSGHPRGWGTDIGHQRKVNSYKVEATWYEKYSSRSQARLPHCYGVRHQGDEMVIVLEDLDAAGYDVRKRSVEWKDISNCLLWLAKFHASFLEVTPDGLWDIGTYWHLDTRPEELEALNDVKLKNAAVYIDNMLTDCKYKTLVHGDAKLANFCFSKSGEVAGVDFQYVGGGCGMKDVAYFIGSCLSEKECERLEERILDTYFKSLQSQLPSSNYELEKEWRLMYRIAWADFHRFLKGWSPEHWKINSYSERVTREVIESLEM